MQSVPPLPTVVHSNNCISCSLVLVAIGPIATGMCSYYSNDYGSFIVITVTTGIVSRIVYLYFLFI